MHRTPRLIHFVAVLLTSVIGGRPPVVAQNVDGVDGKPSITRGVGPTGTACCFPHRNLSTTLRHFPTQLNDPCFPRWMAAAVIPFLRHYTNPRKPPGAGPSIFSSSCAAGPSGLEIPRDRGARWDLPTLPEDDAGNKGKLLLYTLLGTVAGDVAGVAWLTACGRGERECGMIGVTAGVVAIGSGAAGGAWLGGMDLSQAIPQSALGGLTGLGATFVVPGDAAGGLGLLIHAFVTAANARLEGS